MTGTRSWASVGNPDIRTLTNRVHARTHFSGRTHEFGLFAAHPTPSHGFPIVDHPLPPELTNHDVFALRARELFSPKFPCERFSREVDTPRRLCPLPTHASLEYRI